MKDKYKIDTHLKIIYVKDW